MQSIPRRWAIIGALLGLLAGVLAFAPALWLALAVQSATGAQLQLADPRGTVWHGSAQLVLAGGAGSQDAMALPGRLQWELGWGGLGLQLRLSAACCIATPLRIDLRPGWGRAVLTVSDGRVEWPAALLAGLGAPWNTVQLQGLLRLETQGLSVEWNEGRASVTGSAKLDGLGMSSSLSTVRPIGSYRMTLVGAASQGPPVLQLQTLEGSLKLTGSGQWTGSHWSFRGDASAAPDDEPALGNLLNMVGRRQGARSVISLG